MMYGFYSVDITIDAEGVPHLVEINGSNSGFDGFSVAYGNADILDAIIQAFDDLVGPREVFVVNRLVNFGVLPEGYLDKLLEDQLYFRVVQNVHRMLPKGVSGRSWARFRADKPPSGRGAPASIDALSQLSSRFRQVMLNVADLSYVLPSEFFNDQTQAGRVRIKEEIRGVVEAIPLRSDDVLWLRCPTLGFAQPVSTGQLINPEFPYDAVADNKLFTYEILRDAVAENLPLSIPIGNRVSSSATLSRFIRDSDTEFFIRKPLLSSQARGIEILRRADICEYRDRLKKLEDDEKISANLPIELVGVPDLLAAWALSFDVSVLSELRLSKPVLSRRTSRLHHGCIRSLSLIKQNGTDLDMRFLGAYWRLAPTPIDGDGLLWERYVGSQSQGAFCEAVSSEDKDTVEVFAKQVLAEYVSRLAALPTHRAEYQAWEENYWLSRYRREAALFSNHNAWLNFLNAVDQAKQEASRSKHDAEEAGYLRTPGAILTDDEVRVCNLPYLIQEPHRIIVP